MVQCAKTERQCLNSCSGVDNSDLNYDFHTIVGITELGVISLGAEGHAAAEANCSIKNTILEVPAFGGGKQSITSNSCLDPSLQQLVRKCNITRRQLVNNNRLQQRIRGSDFCVSPLVVPAVCTKSKHADSSVVDASNDHAVQPIVPLCFVKLDCSLIDAKQWNSVFLYVQLFAKIKAHGVFGPLVLFIKVVAAVAFTEKQ